MNMTRRPDSPADSEWVVDRLTGNRDLEVCSESESGFEPRPSRGDSTLQAHLTATSTGVDFGTQATGVPMLPKF